MTKYDPAVPIERYRAELLRWNTQINLVSRQETGDRLNGLFDQCRQGLGPVWRWLDEIGPDRPVWYFDLGSGGGIPGVLWHCSLMGRRPVSTWLVEPRDKRAWFLERVGRLPGMPPFGVLEGRWGAVEATGEADPGAVLISLKALRLTDRVVLDGLAAALGGRLPRARVMIARFYPPEQIWSKDLAAGLALPDPGVSEGPLVSLGAGVDSLGPDARASLLISKYGPAD